MPTLARDSQSGATPKSGSEYTLSEQDRTVEYVRSSASLLLGVFKSKLEALRGKSEVTEKLLRVGFNKEACFDEAIKFFGSDEVRYIAIDGTEFEQEKLDMLVFYAGASAYGGLVHFSEEDGVAADPPSSEAADSFSLSSAIPVSEEYSSSVSGESTEGGVEVDTSKVPQALMRLSEYFLAFRAIKGDPNIRIVIMDRTISGDIAHTIWKLREYIADGKCALEGFETSAGKVSRVDLELGRMLIDNPALDVPAPRSQLLKFAAMRLLIDSPDPLSVVEILSKLDANPERGRRLLEDLRKNFVDSLDSICQNDVDRVQPKWFARDYWVRLLEASERVCGSIFDPPQGEHPLTIKIPRTEEGGGDKEERKWIRTEDIEYLTLVLIYALLREAWRRNVLLLGVVKDSNANELVKTVIPTLENAGILSFGSPPPSFDSDRMLLHANSVANPDLAKTPWRTFEYDMCFRTISPVPDSALPEGEARVEGAFKNVITAERMFAKAYFQLWSSPSEPPVRSHVFLYDRPCYPQYDMPGREGPIELRLRHQDSVEEKIVPTLHCLEDSPFSDLVMGLLFSMGTEAIPEALGHSYPLFLADKKAKWMEDEAEKACLSAVELEVTRSRLQEQILYGDSFRDYRESFESRRKSKSGKRGQGQRQQQRARKGSSR